MQFLGQLVGLAMTLLSVGSVQSAMPQSEPLTVCSVLADAPRYNGEMVRIRARVVSTGEGTWLVGSGCDGAMTVSGYAWPSIIWLAYPDSRVLKHPVAFDFDWKSQARTTEKYEKSRTHWAEESVEWTYSGMFETRSDWWNYVGPDGKLNKYSGFGHLGGAPAQLIIRSLDDVEEAAARVEGSVVDPTRGGIVYAPVSLRGTSGTDKSYTTRTDTKGRFRFDVSPGEYELSVKIGGFARASEILSLRPGTAERVIELHPDCSPPAICDDFGMSATPVALDEGKQNEGNSQGRITAAQFYSLSDISRFAARAFIQARPPARRWRIKGAHLR